MEIRLYSNHINSIIRFDSSLKNPFSREKDAFQGMSNKHVRMHNSKRIQMTFLITIVEKKKNFYDFMFKHFF